mgnify:CR=1 FL=1
MATVIKLKKSETASSVPDTSDIVVGEVAISAVDGKLYIRKQDDSIKSIDANEDDVIALAIALG